MLMNKQRLKKIDKLILVAIVSALFSFVALNLARIGFRNYDTRQIKYDENSKINYQVYLKPNDFFQDEYLPENMTYVTSLIDYIKLNFDYNLKFDKKLSGNCSYYIKGITTASQENSDSRFYTREYTLSDVKTKSFENTDTVNIDETIDLDYETYNNVLVDFRNEFGVQMDGNFRVVLVVENLVTDDVTGKDASVKSETEINIPLTTLTVEVPIESDEQNKNGILISEKIEKQGSIYIVLRVLAVICYAVAFITLIYFIYLTYLSFKLENAYQKKLKKILKVYDGIIVNIKEVPKMDSNKIIHVSSFEELIDAHGEVRNPINYISEKDGALFILVSENYIYSYKLERELFSSTKSTKKKKSNA